MPTWTLWARAVSVLKRNPGVILGLYKDILAKKMETTIMGYIEMIRAILGLSGNNGKEYGNLKYWGYIGVTLTSTFIP